MYHYTSRTDVNALGTREMVEYIQDLQGELSNATSFIEAFIDLYKDIEPSVAHKDEMVERAEKFINEHEELDNVSFF